MQRHEIGLERRRGGRGRRRTAGGRRRVRRAASPASGGGIAPTAFSPARDSLDGSRSPPHKFKIPFFLAGPRSATAALVQICLCHVNVAIDLPGLPQIPAPATDQSCAATSSANTLIGVGCTHAPPSRANLHSLGARGATAYHFPRVPSLKAFGRRPRCKPHRCDQPNPQQHRTRGAANDNPSALRTLV